MPVSQLPQAPYRQDRRIYPTPDSGDVLFSQVKDCSRSDIPAYGTPHPDSAKWPYHKLVFVKTVDIERDGLFEFFYAADREEQDRYNFSFGYRNIIGNVGGREFRVVTRTYLTLRSEFDPLFPAFKTPMPEVPDSTFDGINYLFFDKKQAKSEPELDSLYVIEERTYVEESFLDLRLSYGVQKPEVVPEKFRNIIPNVSEEYIEEGIASVPTLANDEISVSEDQLNPNVKLIKKTKRNALVLPVNIPNGQLIVNDYGGIVATRKESLVEDGTATESGYGIIDSSVSALGNGQSVKVTIEAPKDANGNVLFPTIYGAQIDSRYGVPLAFSSSIIPSNSESGGLYYGADGSFGSVDIQPKDQWHSTRSTTYLQSLPTPQTWYGLRRENLPEVLLSVDVSGLERFVAVPTWKRVPDGPLKSKTTRSFTHGPPPDNDAANSRIVYASEAFQAVIEYTSKSTSTSESVNVGTSKGSSTNESQSTSINSSTSESSGTSRSTSEGTASSTGTTATSGSSQSSGTSSQNGSSSSSGTSSQNGSSSSSGTSTQSGFSSSSGVSTQSGFSSSTGTSNQGGLSSSTGQSTQSGNSASEGNSFSESSSSGSGETRDQLQTNKNGGYVWNSTPAVSKKTTVESKKEFSSNNGYNTSSQNSASTGTSTQSGNSSSGGSSSQSGNSSSSGNSTQSGNSSSSGASSQNGNSSSSGSSTQSGTSSSSGSSSQSGTSSSTGQTTQSGTNQSSSNSTSSGTSINKSESDSDTKSNNKSTSVSESENKSTSTTTSTSFFTLSIPKCLRNEITVSLPSGETVVIPATTPTTLDGWIEVARQSEHWRHGIWVTEVVEVYI